MVTTHKNPFKLPSPNDPLTGTTGADNNGRLVVFKNDPFESNNSLANATFLGAGPTINVDPVIDPGPSAILPFPFPPVPGDADFFQFVAQETGTLDFQLFFDPVGTLANGRDGLPGDGLLEATFFDNDGTEIANSAPAVAIIDNASGNQIGVRVTIPVVIDETYFVRIQADADAPGIDDGADAINVYNFTAVIDAAPIPQVVDLFGGTAANGFLDTTDSGRSNVDDVTFFDAAINGPAIFNIVLDDDRLEEFLNLDLVPDTVDDDAFDDGDFGIQVFNNGESIGFAFFVADSTWQFTASAGDLNEGDFNHISAAVVIRDAADPEQVNRGELSLPLQVELDTIAPPIQFGVPANLDGLVDSSDSGVLTDPATFSDRVTNDTMPSFVGIAEANAIVRLFADTNDNGVLDIFDQLVGQTTAIPIDGNLAEPDGFFEVTSTADLNELFGVRDGLRRLFVTAEDLAGNVSPIDEFSTIEIFLDTQGPQVFDPAGITEAIHPAGFPDYDLFDPKPSEFGFTPLTRQITINVRDLPVRSNVDPNFLYNALQQEIAEDVGNYSLVGDHVGTIGIVDVIVNNAPPINGQQATATIDLVFADFLPDDRFTLTISDNLVDPAGNNFDGESNANGPLDDPTFPSGDDIPGGDFVGRFTIDSRPEIGSFVAQNINIDINGNFVWDPANDQIGNDATNVDLTFTLDVANADGSVGVGGYNEHDVAFAGRFVAPNAQNVPLRLFDQLAAYGFSNELGVRRWIVDTDSDGVITLGTDLFTIQPDIAGFNVAGAIPVAGNFDGNLVNGDEIGLYFAGQWALDVNRNFVIEPSEVQAQGNLFGHPIVGDFDGNGVDDFGVFNNNQFSFDLSGDFQADDFINWGFPGVLERPVAADFNQDGVDDIGLWVPRNSAQDNRPIAEWYLLISDPGIANFGTVDAIDHPFEPVPFGRDLFAEFGDELALPIVGNFDPPVTAVPGPDTQSFQESGDFDQDGDTDGFDFLAWQRGYGLDSSTGPEPEMSDGDGNDDGVVDQLDLAIWSNNFGLSTSAATSSAAAAITSESSTATAAEPTTVELAGINSAYLQATASDSDPSAKEAVFDSLGDAPTVYRSANDQPLSPQPASSSDYEELLIENEDEIIDQVFEEDELLLAGL